ncbi:unnamed protein product [Schistosoma turkestanicum]|nr:unnamed protein product [Schistosoma turkestanicum]
MTFTRKLVFYTGRNRECPGKELEQDVEQPLEFNATHFTDPFVFDNEQLSKYELKPEDTSTTTTTIHHSTSTRFIQCSNDRLQLLQSLCPSAAAATILLGKPIHDVNDNDDDDDMNQKPILPTNNNLDKTRVLVTANSWCPLSLRSKDPESQLLINSIYKDNNNNNNNSCSSNSSSNGNSPTKTTIPKQTPSSATVVPEPTIRGGTLDGLLIYALHLLQMPILSNVYHYLFFSVNYSYLNQILS